jgi:hypothetical protein
MVVRAPSSLVLGVLGMLSVSTACWTGSGAAPRSAEIEDTSQTTSTSTPASPPRRPPPKSCSITLDPPVAATSLGTLHIELPATQQLGRLELHWTSPDGSAGTSVQMGTAMAYSLNLRPGTYAAEIVTQDGGRARCTDITVAAGGATTLTISRLER